ncbi:pyridoxamine 5'-phosphate oxidase family protein [Streptomyces sp. NPDC051985]|uniref:pyridoxamine 5'-phosphate oxidase family protein n=1 Tax=Streptomyces sp. NPDC051985 TaxID=3155807 RepID=UPI00341F4B01
MAGRPANAVDKPAEKIDLTGHIATSLNTAMERERPAVVGVVALDGTPSVSYRGSVHVHSQDQVAIWVRKQDTGLAADVTANPAVTILYYDPAQGPDPAVGARRIVIKGRARVDASLNDVVYAGIPEVERERDADRRGVAVVVDVDSVIGFGGTGPIKMARDAD